jgi:hypothetical protein
MNRIHKMAPDLWAVLLYIKEILDLLSAGRLAIRARIFFGLPEAFLGPDLQQHVAP